jgi:hypothetical protein
LLSLAYLIHTGLTDTLRKRNSLIIHRSAVHQDNSVGQTISGGL